VPPTLEAFVEYALQKDISEQDAIDQFQIWSANEWRDGHGVQIKQWKGKLFTQKNIRNLPSDKRAKCEQPKITKKPNRGLII
jgi:hypothetical protein